MIKTFTQNDLIRFLYQETSEEETKEISKALLCDSDLQNQYVELLAITKEVSRAEMQPSSSAILNILSYSRSMQEKHT